MADQQTEADQVLRDRGAAGGLIEFVADRDELNAAVLREVLTAEPIAGALPLTLSGARIRGDLDLTGGTIKRGVTFRDCKFERIGLEDSETRSLRFEGGECRGIWGNRARIKGELALGRGFESWGPVAFDEGHVEGSVFLNGGKFWPSAAEDAGPKVLSFERTRIEQALVIDDEFAASGNVRLIAPRLEQMSRSPTPVFSGDSRRRSVPRPAWSATGVSTSKAPRLRARS